MDPDRTSDPRDVPSKNWSQQFGPFLTLGLQLALTVGACTCIGWLLDRWLETTPWCMVGGVLLGAAGGIISFSKTVLKLGKQQDANAAEESRRKAEHNEN